jgi:hypothetical protein
LEDLRGISENLRIFNNKRSQITNKDILSYKTPNDLAGVVRPFIKIDDSVPEYFHGREAEIAAPKHTDILLSNAEFLVVHPKDMISAQFFGYHTGTNGQPWCIAWGIPKTKQQNAANQFSNYTSNDRLPQSRAGLRTYCTLATRGCALTSGPTPRIPTSSKVSNRTPSDSYRWLPSMGK